MISKNYEKNLVSDYVVFDLETTGLDATKDEIIEIGALKYINDTLVDELDILVKPNNPIPDVITSITGITNDMVSDSPTIKEALPKFIEFIENYSLIAHNSSFDLSFIEENINKLQLPMINNKNIDTVYLARKYIPKAYNYKLETLKKFFKLDYGSHRSTDDCRTTNYVYQHCKKEALIKN